VQERAHISRSLVLQNQVFLWHARRSFLRCFLRLSVSLFHLLLLVLLLGPEAGGGFKQESQQFASEATCPVALQINLGKG